MLYKGDTKHYQHILADDRDHESDLKDQGYVDFADLEEWTGMADVGSVSSTDLKNALVPIEQFDAISEELVELKLQLNVAQTKRDENIAEVERLNAIIERGSQENIELRKQLDEFTSQAGQAVDAKPKTTKPKAEQ